MLLVEVTRTFTTPEFPCRGNKRPERTLLCHLSDGGFHRWRDSNPHSLDEVTRAYATLQLLCGGNRRFTYLSDARPLSYSNFRRWQGSNLRPSALSKYPEPSPRHKLFSLYSFPPYVVTSLLLPPRTPVAFLHCDVSFRQRNPPNIFPGGISAHGLWDLNPEPCGPLPSKYP
jgi:hypothetical protein